MNQTVIALGFFDGVHRGHGALLEKTVQRAQELGAEPMVFTFDRPPKEVESRYSFSIPLRIDRS